MKYTITIMVLLLTLGIFNPAVSQGGLSLQDAIRLSREHSFGIRSATYDSLAAANDLGAAQALRFPAASLNATTYYINDVPTAKFGFQTLTLGLHENYQADFRVSMPLYTGGKISNQIKVQNALALSRVANLDAERFADAYAVRKAYLGLLAAQAVAASAKASLDRVKVINQDIASLYANGMADSADILDAALALEKARQAQDERATSVRNAIALLARRIGMPLDSDIMPLDSVTTPEFNIYENQRPTAEAIKRPELNALQRRIQAANYLVGVNKASYLPTLSGYGGYSVGKPNRDQFGKKWNDYWSAGLNLYWEFNLGGKSIKSTMSAKNSAMSASISKDDLLESLTLQSNVAWENLKLAYESYVTSGKQYGIAEHQYRIGLEKQKAGKISVNRLLEMEGDLTSMEQLYKASAVNYFISETEYLYAIGSPEIYGGF